MKQQQFLKKEYVAPVLTVVSFKVEHGYAATLSTLGDMQLGFVDELVSQTDMMMGEQMSDLTNGGTDGNGYFGFGVEGTGTDGYF